MTTAAKNGLIVGQDGTTRCFWCGDDPEYQRYHDEEWGFPVHGDVRIYEKLCLEGFQSGLSWITILRKRPAFREAFAGFDFRQVARFDQTDVERLLGNAGIVRHRKKIESTINNARRALELLEEFDSLADYAWQFQPEPDERPDVVTRATIPSKTASSAAMAKDLKRRGWSFLGPTTVYAFMQSVGIVNDHIEGCSIRPKVERL